MLGSFEWQLGETEKEGKEGQGVLVRGRLWPSKLVVMGPGLGELGVSTSVGKLSQSDWSLAVALVWPSAEGDAGVGE